MVFRMETVGAGFLTCAVFIMQGKLTLKWMDLITNIRCQVSFRIYDKMSTFLKKRQKLLLCAWTVQETVTRYHTHTCFSWGEKCTEYTQCDENWFHNYCKTNAGEICHGAKLLQPLLIPCLPARNFTVCLYTGMYECFQRPSGGMGTWCRWAAISDILPDGVLCSNQRLY